MDDKLESILDGLKLAGVAIGMTLMIYGGHKLKTESDYAISKNLPIEKKERQSRDPFQDVMYILVGGVLIALSGCSLFDDEGIRRFKEKRNEYIQEGYEHEYKYRNKT